MKFQQFFIQTFMIFVAFFPLASTSHAESKAKTYLEQIDRIAISGLPSKEIARDINEKYFITFENEKTITIQSSLSDKELQEIFEATDMTSYYVHSAYLAKRLSVIFNELDRRKVASEKHVEKLYAAFIGARLFDNANALKERINANESLELLPALSDRVENTPVIPTEWEISEGDNLMTRRAANVTTGVTIVVLVHPRCHFSRNAITSILADTDLKAIFETHAHLIAPQTNKIDFKLLQYWNKVYPTLSIALMHKHDEWPFIEEWGTPQFYFLKNGEVKGHVEGWPKAGNKEKLLAAFRLLQER